MRTLSRILIGLISLTAVAGAGLLAAAPAQAASQRGGQITRSEVISRAAFWYNERNSLVYDSSRDSSSFYPDPGGDMYAPDCSGFVSMAWHVAFGQPNESAGGYNTQHLPDISTEISFQSLQPGDLINDFYHHAILFNAWEPDHVHFSYYSFGSSPIAFVTHASQSDSTWSSHPVSEYKFYRYNNIVDDQPPTVRVAGVFNPSANTVEVYFNSGGTLMEKYWTSSGWHGPVGLTPGITGNPAAVSDPVNGNLEVYFNSGGTLTEKVWSPAGWSANIALASGMSGDPSVVYNPTAHTMEIY
jgi:hypothetical protein